MEEEFYTGCLTLPAEYADARDFKAEEAIELDMSIKLPESFSLGKWIYKTNNQGRYGSCTSNATSHGVQILEVEKAGKEPKTSNIATPKRQDLWTKMGHDMGNVSDSGDYVENAVSTALKQGIELEEGGLAKFDGYATSNWSADDKCIELMKRYIYNEKPIIWCMRGNSTTRADLRRGELKSDGAFKNWTQGHAICLVGWDKDGFWYVNSRTPNDGKNLKCRFFVSYNNMKLHHNIFNYRYRVLYNKKDAKKDPEYLKRKNNQLMVIAALKKIYEQETTRVKIAIEEYSKVIRGEYPEINEELPK